MARRESMKRHRLARAKWGRLYLLTATAASFPVTVEPFTCASHTMGCRGPLHSSSYSCCSSTSYDVGLGLSTKLPYSIAFRRAGLSSVPRDLKMTVGVSERPTCKGGPSTGKDVLSSTVTPSSAYMSQPLWTGRATVVPKFSTDRYGGRASGVWRNDKLADGDELMLNHLGFRVEDEGRMGQTKLQLARRSVEDDAGTQPPPSISNYLPKIVSPLKNQYAASLLRRQEEGLKVPAWFPWLPNRDQIEALKHVELREACAERGLRKSGSKVDLQERLMEWTTGQHRRRVADRRGTELRDSSMQSESKIRETSIADSLSSTTFNSRAKDMRNYTILDLEAVDDLEPLLKRRKEILERASGRKEKESEIEIDPASEVTLTPTKEYLSALTKAFNLAPAKYSNYEVHQMYASAKRADQVGDRKTAKNLLYQLRDATPHDGRVLRRLARMETEVGNVDAARQILQKGIRSNPQDAHLHHGLGQLELRAGDDEAARKLYKDAIQINPGFPNPYHALGTLEHSRGNIRVATKVIEEGLTQCPNNHRLHHALGDLYREAGMLNDAERCYKRVVETGPVVSRPFAYTSLSYVAYEKGNLAECRYWLRKGLEINNGRHSQGWVALAQLEESEGDVDAARKVYLHAADLYELGLIQRSSILKASTNAASRKVSMAKRDGVSPKSHGTAIGDYDKLLASAPVYRSGDKWINVYRSWARVEEEHGTYVSVNDVYKRAAVVFPQDWRLFLNWAKYQARNGRVGRARTLFEIACDKSGNRHADPYRSYAEFEMSQANFTTARSILYRGAQAVSESSDGGLGNRRGLARLFHSWAVCEWHLDNVSRAEVLFDHALRLTDAGEDGSELRSFILYSIAMLEYSRGEYSLAQHCVALCLKENLMPGGNSKIWVLWSDIATEMGNKQLARQCKEEAAALSNEEESGIASLSKLLGRAASGGPESSARSPMMKVPEVQQLLRKEPWHYKIFYKSERSWHEGIEFPKVPELKR